MVILTGLAIYSTKPVTSRRTATNESGTDEEVIHVPTDQVNFKSTEVTVKVTVDDTVSEDLRTIDRSKENSASVNHDSKSNGELTTDNVVVS